MVSCRLYKSRRQAGLGPQALVCQLLLQNMYVKQPFEFIISSEGMAGNLYFSLKRLLFIFLLYYRLGVIFKYENFSGFKVLKIQFQKRLTHVFALPCIFLLDVILSKLERKKR